MAADNPYQNARASRVHWFLRVLLEVALGIPGASAVCMDHWTIFVGDKVDMKTILIYCFFSTGFDVAHK